MTTNATTAAPLVTRLLHLPITSDAEAFVSVARATERAVVHLGNPGFEDRDRLGRFLVRGIETELGRLGAAPPGWKYEDGLESILGDQLYRARLLGCFGLALSLPPLRDLADVDGQLGAEDSHTLRRLVAVAECEPLQLYLPRPCADLRIIGNSEPLSAWLPASVEPGRVASIEYDDPASDGYTSDAGPAESASSPLLLAPPLEAFLGRSSAPLDETPAPVCVCDEESPEPPSVAATTDDTTVPLVAAYADANPAEVEVEVEAEVEVADPAPAEGAAARAPSADAAAQFPASTSSASTSGASRGVAPADDARAHAAAAGEGASASSTPAPPTVEPQRVQRCLTLATHLGSMNGPKVHGTVEKAFITAYLPLCREIAAGAAPVEASAAAERWAEGFAQSYASAFRQFGSRARRPRMVKDVIDLGVQWLGQHRARQCQLLLVSAMRFDLGQRLNEELERRFAGVAMCADQSVLWAALPSNAEAQQLGAAEPSNTRRGRGEPTASDPGAVVPFNVGNRGLFRLDHLSAELNRPGECEAARLQRLAAELADRVEPWIRTQPPETLIAVFGDHGFHWQATPAGTGAAQRGGALPEQVLVSASAWLLREHRHKARVAPGIH